MKIVIYTRKIVFALKIKIKKNTWYNELKVDVIYLIINAHTMNRTLAK